ncbi:helix-turn-helix transcriptional regulator [Microlunatus sp. Gsoil 973]|uniref:ArsR/SmtB family transcription factor n=1 Tax=Microlunatus sp. Gsoil 973 TaxID=2672569 RepID=UPI0012B4AF99|nr:helix-turn-helix transcriptional regulator [Microlunatus sp. Gsoil 973]QGN32180.1 ArsR family transcriptional regulator [Microlunatus sp. Gsoil 973]
MSTQLPEFVAAARPRPVLRVADPSLAATVPNAMLLVDYALHQNATPSAELAALAQGLPTELVESSRTIRVALAHGAVLRAVLLHQLPAGHPGHHDWAPLRSTVAEWSDAFVNAVIDHGIDSNLRWEHPELGPGPSAASLVPVAEPSRLVRHRGAEVLRSWRTPDADERAAELLDPAGLRTALLDLLDAIWDGWLGSEWADQLPRLRAAVGDTPAPPPGCSPTQWISLVTGLQPDPSYAGAAEQASELVIMPSVGLGRSLSLFTDRTTWVLYTPQPGPDPAADHRRTGISIGRLGQLAPSVTALGDKTRLALVLHLLDHGPLTMQQLADALEVHQSTISRQVTVLRKAGIVIIRDDRRVEVDRAVIRTTAETLLATLE